MAREQRPASNQSDALRAGVRAAALAMVDDLLDEATQAGYYGSLALYVQDGIVDHVRADRTLKVPRLKTAA